MLQNLTKISHKRSDNLLFNYQTRQGAFEFWRASAAPFCDMTPVSSEATNRFFQSQHFFSDRVMLSLVQYGAKATRHTKRHVDQVGDIVRIQRFHAGGMLGQYGGAPFEVRPGTIAFVDQSQTFEMLHDASLSQGVYLSRSALGIEESGPISIRPLAPDLTITRVLHAEMDRLFNPLLAGDRGLASAAFDRFLACARMAVHKGAQDRDIRAQARDALRDVICQYIEDRLQSPILTADVLLREFGVSRASLYRMFEDAGGVRNYISSRRLFRAVHMISTNPLKRGQVISAAERWGFTSAANFNRMVRRVFGTSPGSMFLQPLSDLELPHHSEPFARFLNFARSASRAGRIDKAKSAVYA